MIAADILIATGPVVTLFERLDVPYYIGGSVASSAYGIPRSTLDVDLVADFGRDLVEPFVRLLSDAYYLDRDLILRAVDQKTSFNLIHLQTMLKIDVFIKKGSPYDALAFIRRRTERLDEAEGAELFFLAAPEDVLLHKLIWYRMGGGVSDRQWHDVIGILKVQGQSLDFPYMRLWAAELGVSDLLERALDLGHKGV